MLVDLFEICALVNANNKPPSSASVSELIANLKTLEASTKTGQGIAQKFNFPDQEQLVRDTKAFTAFPNDFFLYQGALYTMVNKVCRIGFFFFNNTC